MSSPPKKKRPPYHHSDLRSALLQATGDIIREKGIAFVSLREVARKVNVSHAAPAHHFPTKASLISAFAAQGYNKLAGAVRKEISKYPSDNPRRRLQAVGEGYVRFALSNPEHFSIMFRVDYLDADDPQFRAAADAAFGALMQVVGECAAAGLIPPKEVQAVAVGAWSLVHGFATLWIGGRLPLRLKGAEPHVFASKLAAMFTERILGGNRKEHLPER